MEWTYKDLQKICAFYGFTYCPLTETEAMSLQASCFSLDGAYGVACDVACGIPFGEAMKLGEEVGFG